MCLLWMCIPHVLEPTPPLIIQPLVLTMPSVLVMTASGYMMTMPATLTKTGAALMSRIGSVKKWGMRRRRGTGSTPSVVINGLLSFNSCFFQSFSNLPFLPSAKSQSQDAPDCTPRPKTSMLPFSLSMSSPNGTSSAANTQHTHMH